MQDEVARREQKKFTARVRRAGFRGEKTLEGFDFSLHPQLNQELIRDLATCRFIDEKVSLLIAGLGRARLVDPVAPGVIASQRDDSGAGENYLSLTPTGRGHALGTLCCLNEARLVLVDYSASGDLSSVQTLIASVTVPGLSMLSGEAAFDSDRMFDGGFEDGEF